MGAPPPTSTRCCPRPPRAGLGGALGDRTARVRRVPALVRSTACPPGLGQLFDGMSYADGRLASTARAPPTCRATRTRRSRPRRESPSTWATGVRRNACSATGGRTKAAFNVTSGCRSAATTPWAVDRGQAAGGQPGLEHGPLPVDGHRRRRPRACVGRGSRSTGRDVHRVGRAHPRRYHGRLQPVSYHNGSVWPHDNAILVAGLMRYGFVEEAQRVRAASERRRRSRSAARAVLRLRTGRVRAPVPYPTSCSPQAWASASPLLLSGRCSASTPTSRSTGSAPARSCRPSWGPCTWTTSPRHRAGRTDGGRRRRHASDCPAAWRSSPRSTRPEPPSGTRRVGGRRGPASPDAGPEGRGTSASLEAISADRHS